MWHCHDLARNDNKRDVGRLLKLRKLLPDDFIHPAPYYIAAHGALKHLFAYDYCDPAVFAMWIGNVLHRHQVCSLGLAVFVDIAQTAVSMKSIFI